MATEISDAPVETAPATPAPATASDAQESAAVETTPTPSSQESMEDVDAEFRRFYDTPAAQSADAGTTEEPAPTGQEEQPTGEQPAGDAAKPAEVQTPPDESKDPEQLPDQIRPRLKDPVDIAIAGLQRAKGLASFGEAAKLYYSLDKAPESQIPGTAATAPAGPSPTQQLETDIATLAEEIKGERAAGDYLTPEHLDKVERLTELRGDLRMAKYREAQAAREAQTRVQAAQERAASDWESSAAQARRDYPSISDPDSSLFTAAAAVRSQWEAAKDPRLAGPNAPVALLEEAANRVAAIRFKENGIPKEQTLAALKAAPASPAALASKVPVPLSPQTSAPKQPDLRRVAPASGSKGQQSGSQPSTLGEAVAEAKTADDIDAVFQARYGPKTYSLGG